MPVDDITRDLMTREEKTWYTLKYGAPRLRVIKRARHDQSLVPGCRYYIEYILTDKPDGEVK